MNINVGVQIYVMTIQWPCHAYYAKGYGWFYYNGNEPSAVLDDALSSPQWN